MKLNKLLYLTMVGALLVSCGDDKKYQPADPVSENAALLWFENADERGLELDPELNITTHEVTLARLDSTEALTVNLNATVNTDNKFVVPQTVSFEAGKGTTTFTVTFEDLNVGDTYSLTLSLDESAYNPYKTLYEDDDETYKVPFYYLSVTPIKYEDAKGIFYDDIMSTYGTGKRAAWWVDYQIATLPSGTKKVRIFNPYYSLPTGDADENGIYPECPFNEEGDLLDEGDYNIYLNISADGVVDMDPFYLGVDWGYGPVFAQILRAYGEYYADSVITFSRANQALANGDDEGLYQYAGFDLYLTLKAYQSSMENEPSKPVEPVDADVDTYVGEWVLNGYDYDTDEEVAINLTIETDEDEDGQYYIISGLHEDAPEIYGYFDEETGAMSWQASYGEIVEIDGKKYQTYFFPIDGEGYPSGKVTIDFVPAEDGTLVVSENSESVELTLYYENVTNEDDYQFGIGIYDFWLEPNEDEEEASAPKQAKVKMFNHEKSHRHSINTPLTHRKSSVAGKSLKRK